MLAGEVRLRDGRRATSPASSWPTTSRWLSRSASATSPAGASSWRPAFARWGVEAEGRRCLDVGASTGGFTDCLLQHGAAAVVALDVAYGELHWRLRQDRRVIVVERTNARSLQRGELPFQPDLIVADVSFISLTEGPPGGGRKRRAAV